MVGNITNLSRSGLRDWLIQRVTAVIMGVYILFLLGYLVIHPQLDFSDWQILFSYTFMRVFSFLVLLSMVYHTWVGMWTVFTDYVKPTFIRLVLQLAMILALLAYLIWGIEILWGL